MTVDIKCIGTIFVPMFPISSIDEKYVGQYMHDYRVEADDGRIEIIRDTDLLGDGKYTVADNFFDTVTILNQVELEEDEW